jgi:hypothetical protein
MSMKNSDTIGNRSRELPVCRAVPQPLRHRVRLCMSVLILTDIAGLDHPKTVADSQAHIHRPNNPKKVISAKKIYILIKNAYVIKITNLAKSKINNT